MNIETLGVDIAKNVFQLHGVDRNGRVVLKRRVMRDQLLVALTQIERCTVIVEACMGAFYWARKFEALGHQAKIISPQISRFDRKTASIWPKRTCDFGHTFSAKKEPAKL